MFVSEVADFKAAPPLARLAGAVTLRTVVDGSGKKGETIVNNRREGLMHGPIASSTIASASR
jgi:hypothetical protein